MIQREGLQPMLPVAVSLRVGLILMGVYLARVRAYDAEDFGALKRSLFAPFLRHLTFRWHAGQVLLDLGVDSGVLLRGVPYSVRG